MTKIRKFHREKNQRRAFLKSLAVSLVVYGKIKTTLARAKELRTIAERLVTHAKKHDTILLKYRKIRKFLPKAASKKLVKDIAPRYKERNGGYTRIIKIAPRAGDAAKMAIIEFVRHEI